MTALLPLDLSPCAGCGFSSSGVSLDCLVCLQRHPELFLQAVESMADELDSIRPVAAKAREWHRAFRRAVGTREAAYGLAAAVEAWDAR